MSLLERVERAGNGACPREGAEGALGLDALKEQVLAGGALAMNIAGSGPSVFALASNYEAAVRISGEMKRHFEGLGIGCNSYAGRVSNAGARVVE